MTIEHPLTSEQARFVREYIELMNKHRQTQLTALGQAREAEYARAAVAEVLAQVLGVVERDAKLPSSPAGYQLSADGLKLVGETAETGAVALPLTPLVNGRAVEHDRA